MIRFLWPISCFSKSSPQGGRPMSTWFSGCSVHLYSFDLRSIAAGEVLKCQLNSTACRCFRRKLVTSYCPGCLLVKKGRTNMSVDNLWCLFFFKILLTAVLPVGKYMSTVFTGGYAWLDPIMDPIDKAIYKLDTRRAMPTTPDTIRIDDSHFANILFVNYHDH
jgi:hypothetical protein